MSCTTKIWFKPLFISIVYSAIRYIISSFKTISSNLYADDAQLYLSYKPYELPVLVDWFNATYSWIANNFLQFNENKTVSNFFIYLFIFAPISIIQIGQCLGFLSFTVDANAENLGLASIFDF